MRIFNSSTPEAVEQLRPPIDLDEIDVWIMNQKINTKAVSFSRWFLRTVLSKYVNLAPEKIVIIQGMNGKPLLKQDSVKNVSFNLSHSADLIVCAVAFDKNIGVDIEAVKPQQNMATLVKRFFSTSEQKYLQTLPDAERLAESFRFWVAKEACLKATGEGISEIDKVEISRTGDNQILNCLYAQTNDASWHLESFAPAEGYVGCVAWYT